MKLVYVVGLEEKMRPFASGSWAKDVQNAKSGLARKLEVARPMKMETAEADAMSDNILMLSAGEVWRTCGDRSKEQELFLA
jgi:hypothetical protein